MCTESHSSPSRGAQGREGHRSHGRLAPRPALGARAGRRRRPAAKRLPCRGIGERFMIASSDAPARRAPRPAARGPRVGPPDRTEHCGDRRRHLLGLGRDRGRSAQKQERFPHLGQLEEGGAAHHGMPASSNARPNPSRLRVDPVQHRDRGGRACPRGELAAATALARPLGPIVLVSRSPRGRPVAGRILVGDEGEGAGTAAHERVRRRHDRRARAVVVLEPQHRRTARSNSRGNSSRYCGRAPGEASRWSGWRPRPRTGRRDRRARAAAVRAAGATRPGTRPPPGTGAAGAPRCATPGSLSIIPAVMSSTSSKSIRRRSSLTRS